MNILCAPVPSSQLLLHLSFSAFHCTKRTANNCCIQRRFARFIAEMEVFPSLFILFSTYSLSRLSMLHIPFSTGLAEYSLFLWTCSLLSGAPTPPWVRKLSWSFAVLQLVQLKYNLLQNLAPKFFWQLYFSPKYISPKYFSAVGAVKVQLVIDSIWHNNNNNSCSISPLRFADLGFVTKWIWSKTPNSHIYLPVSREYSQNSISAGENSSLTSM